jgi:integrase
MHGSVFDYTTAKGRRWCYTFRNPLGSAKPKTQKCAFPTRKAATAALHTELVARGSGDWIEPSTLPMRTYLGQWLDGIAPSIAPSTYHNSADMVTHLSDELGYVPLGTLSAPVIDAAYKRLGDGLAPSTLRITHSVLHAALKQAVRWRLRRDNPAEYIVLPALVVEGEIVWSQDEAAHFLRETAGDPNHPLWRLLLSTGMRLGEALALSWGAVDLDVGRVAVFRTLSKDADERLVIVERTKTAAGRRTLDIAPVVVAALRQGRVRQLKERLGAREWDDLGLVFPGRYGRPMQPQTARRRLERACWAADVPSITPKAMRHTAATLMVANGVDMHSVMHRLGHANITLTMNLYAHATPEADKRASEILARVLEG